MVDVTSTLFTSRSPWNKGKLIGQKAPLKLANTTAKKVPIPRFRPSDGVMDFLKGL